MESNANQITPAAPVEKTSYTTLVGITALCACSTVMGFVAQIVILASGSLPHTSTLLITAAPALSLFVTIKFWKRTMAAKARIDGVSR